MVLTLPIICAVEATRSLTPSTFARSALYPAGAAEAQPVSSMQSIIAAAVTRFTFHLAMYRAPASLSERSGSRS